MSTFKAKSAFAMLCKAAGLPEPVAEHRFDPKRRWRVDWYFGFQVVLHQSTCVDHYEWLALEVEGAAWVQGRHTRGSGFLKDMEKYNALALAGIWLLRVTPKQMASGEAVALVRRFAESRGLV